MNLEKGLLLFLVFQNTNSKANLCVYNMLTIWFLQYSKKDNYLEKVLQHLKGDSY